MYINAMPRIYRRKGAKRRPYRKSSTRKGKNTYSKGRSWTRRRTLGARTSPFPKELFTKLHYTDLLEISVTDSAFAQLTYNLNSLYDPYAGVGGHQPRYFDTLCGDDDGPAPYKKYRVLGTHVRATFVNDNSATSTAGIFGMHQRIDGQPQLGAILDTGEIPNTWKVDVNSGNSSQGIRRLSKMFKHKQVFGIKDMRDDEETGALFGTNPAKLSLLDIFYQPYSASTSTTIFVRVEFTYYCHFYDQNFVTAS